MIIIKSVSKTVFWHTAAKKHRETVVIAQHIHLWWVWPIWSRHRDREDLAIGTKTRMSSFSLGGNLSCLVCLFKHPVFSLQTTYQSAAIIGNEIELVQFLCICNGSNHQNDFQLYCTVSFNLKSSLTPLGSLLKITVHLPRKE